MLKWKRGTLELSRGLISRVKSEFICWLMRPSRVYTKKWRKVSTRQETHTTDVLPWMQFCTSSELRRKQLSDLDLQPILQWMERGNRPKNQEACATSPATRHYLVHWDSLVINQGMLFRKYVSKDCTENFQFIVPREMKTEILYRMHSGIMAGHLGRKKTKGKLLARYYWYKVREDINNWIMQCAICGANKLPCRTPRAPMGNMRVGAPLDRITTDFVGPLPITPRGNRYILVGTDSFTKWVEVFAVPDQSAETTARTILNEFIARYGYPIDLHSDQGRNYESAIFKELCQLLEIRKTRTSPRNPRCNGQAETSIKL